jgi:hypothetical protein
MRTRQATRSLALAALVASSTLAACGGGTTTREPNDPADEHTPSGTAGSKRNAPSMQSEVGALDREAVNEVFQSAMGSIQGCVSRARQALPYVDGDFEVFLRIAGDGSVRYAFPRQSTLGHHDTEKCIVDALAKKTWPKPEGGDEGQTSKSFGFDLGDDRPAVAWQPQQLGNAGNALRNALRSCKRNSGTASLSLTLYVGEDGKVVSAGAAVEDEMGIDAIRCAIEAAQGKTFPSPGSYPAKVTLSVN